MIPVRIKLWRPLKWILCGLAALIAIAAIPVIWIETACVERLAKEAAPFQSVLAKQERREEINTYLTYPEWSIVHAYEDMAAVIAKTSESDFPYFSAIRSYWSSFCTINKMASRRGVIAGDYRLMLHVIGLSFAAEMGIEGLYEETVGRLTAWIRGPVKTPEDVFALALADDYAVFLRQSPWYDYPFGAKLSQFWRETSMTGGNPIRKLERRFALTLKWAVKSVYAKAIAAGANATSPVVLRIQSVVKDLDAGDVAADPRISIVRKLDDGASVVEVDRYRTNTQIMQGLASRGRNMIEIAGNTRILVTVQAPDQTLPETFGAPILFKVPLRAKPGWQRVALDVPVPALLELMRRLSATPIVLEHVYDY